MSDRTQANALTIAYIAKGAGAALANLSESDLNELIENYQGEMNVIDDIIGGALLLDQLADGRNEESAGVYLYEVAEEYGAEVVKALVEKTRDFDRGALAVNLVEALCR